MRNVVVYCMPKYPANMKARELSSDMVGRCLTLYVQYAHMLMVSCTIILLYKKALV